jgi:hypothetical protein
MFTGTTLATPLGVAAPLSVIAGQIVQVAVTISFS